MRPSVGWGIGNNLDSHQAGRSAIQQALDMLGSARPACALAIISQDLDTPEAVRGLSGYLSNTPLIGFSTLRPLTHDGETARTVIAILFSGKEVTAHPLWFPNNKEHSKEITKSFLLALQELSAQPGGLLMGIDEGTDTVNQVCRTLGITKVPISGCCPSGDTVYDKTYQVNGSQSSTEALSALVIGGDLRISTAIGHGWKDCGVSFRVSKVQGNVIQGLDNVLPSEAYAGVFNRPAAEWSAPPLSNLIRLYPLSSASSHKAEKDQLIHSPLFADHNGYFHMNSQIPLDQQVHLMIGDPAACLAASRETAKEALAQLGESPPIVGLVWIDAAWRYLFDRKIETVMQSIQSELPDIPLFGAYTSSQITRQSPDSIPQMYSQTIMTTLIGTKQGV